MAGRLLITGASGNIGREIVNRLKDEQVDFIAASRQESFFPPEIRQLTLDYASKALMAEACRDIETLFLLLPLDERMATYAHNALAGAQEAGVQRIVLVSIFGADSESTYLLHKVHGQIDEELQELGIPWTILRPNTFMQSFAIRHREAIQQGAVFLPEGEAKSSFVDTRDIAEIAVEVLLSPESYENKTVDITGEESLSNEEALSFISRALGRRIAYVPVTEAAARHRLHKEGLRPWETEAHLSRHRAAREGVTSEITRHNQEIRGQAARRFIDFCREMTAVWELRNKRDDELEI